MKNPGDLHSVTVDPKKNEIATVNTATQARTEIVAGRIGSGLFGYGPEAVRQLVNERNSPIGIVVHDVVGDVVQIQ